MDDEVDQVWSTATGRIDGMTATLRLTDDGLYLSYAHDPTTVRDLPIEQISEVREQTGLFTGFLTIQVGREKLTVAKIRREDIHPFAVALRTRVPDHPTPPPAEPAAPTSTAPPLEELERLGRLHESGVLTDAEFQTAKATLLKRL